MVNTKMFRNWLAAVTHGLKTPSQIEEEVKAELNDPTITVTKVKVSKNKWAVIDPSELD